MTTTLVCDPEFVREIRRLMDLADMSVRRTQKRMAEVAQDSMS